MKIILAPDSYKGNIRSPEICEIISQAILDQMPNAEVISIPMADGGEGTIEAAVSATGGTLVPIKVHNAVGKKIDATYGLTNDGKTAIMEMASSSGLELLSPEEMDPMLTTTYGTGEMIRAIIESGVRDIIIGIGGSATNDGGAGMAQALGYKFKLPDGSDQVCGCSGGGLGDICGIDAADVIPELKETRIRVACDVTNPLLGPNGAAEVYSPQKGASPEMVEQLEKNMAKYAGVLIENGLTETCSDPGDGAAGGLGFGLRVLTGAEMVSGAELMIELTGMKEHLKNADLLITGEGRTDNQTLSGKLCQVVAETASAKNVPTILLSGAVSGDTKKLLKSFTTVLSITPGPVQLQEALENSRKNLYNTAAGLAALIIRLKN